MGVKALIFEWLFSRLGQNKRQELPTAIMIADFFLLFLFFLSRPSDSGASQLELLLRWVLVHLVHCWILIQQFPTGLFCFFWLLFFPKSPLAVFNCGSQISRHSGSAMETQRPRLGCQGRAPAKQAEAARRQSETERWLGVSSYFSSRQRRSDQVLDAAARFAFCRSAAWRWAR